MTPTPRRPFSVRVGHAEDTEDTLYEGVPAHLLRPLQRWVYTMAAAGGGYLGKTMCLKLRIAVPAKSNASWALSRREGFDLLDAVDEILAFAAEMEARDLAEVRELKFLLDDGHSAYRVREDEAGLEIRVTPAVRDSVQQTLVDAAAETDAGSASDHLAAAWQAAYGLHPDPVRAYSEAVKAVESAAHATVQPNHAKATLGTMLGEIKNARHKFTFAIPVPPGGDSIAAPEALMRALWEGQVSRHGGKAPTPSETQEAARAGVHLAATIVQWFASGAVSRLP
ncbi:hypothetical protein [Streptacidiphilus griseoplanus]|uniref:hypothetical protein n=1 Tax=Peterkaempfera griseoplana TaxID=66896 RepID=UPI000AED5CD9|nr:hypothetical protein [Peterkaempfera griseoplana]